MIEIIPSINCKKEDCVINRFKQINSFKSDWVHIDIADGDFTDWKTWNNPKFIKENINTDSKIEVHLMVEKLDNYINDWIVLGVSRLIVHVESYPDLESLYNKAIENNVEIMLALKPGTDIRELNKYNKDYYSGVQILSVDPGPSGSGFQEMVLGKVKNLRKIDEDVKIEVDGGVTDKNIKMIKEVGVNYIVSASYIFKGNSPKENYNKLKNATSS
ncbi:MAG: hypothetical protein WDZ80_04100 [Candidatus Paceibacterota bacterium]